MSFRTVWPQTVAERERLEKMVRLIESAEKLTGKAEREFADSVLEVSIGGINGTVDTLRAFGHGDLEIKNAIMQRYALSEEAAEGYLYQKS